MSAYREQLGEHQRRSRRNDLAEPRKTSSDDRTFAVRPITTDALHSHAPEFLQRHPLDEPAPNMGTLSIRPNSPQTPLSLSRKRPAGSENPVHDDVTRAESPSSKFHRPSSATFDLAPESQARSVHSRAPRSQKEPPHPFTFTHAPRVPLRNPADQQRSGFYQDFASPDRRHSKLSGAGTRAAVRWAEKRPRGPNVTVNDSINALVRIFDIRQWSTSFTFLSWGDEFAGDENTEDLDINTSIINQPDSRPISQQQLAAEVKGIYSGLVMVESKCVQQVDSKDQAKSSSSGVDHFPALIALHRTLLHEHHDFFLASQHPSAGNAIKELATKYSMPARMWKHGIHNFLELLRHKLPDSLDYMLAFIYLAYQMMALLFETVPTFEDTWIECLGDLGRYRMAIEDEDLRDREVWTGVAKLWYTRAADKNPNIGRLLHHLGILARSNPLQQISLYCRSLTAIQPFTSSRESITTLFDPTIARVRKPSHQRPVSDITWFVALHACMFGVPNTLDLLEKAMTTFLNGLENIMNSCGRECGGFIASSNVASILKYGATTSSIRSVLAPKERPSSRVSCPEPRRVLASMDPDDIVEEDACNANLSHEWRLTLECLHICLRHKTNPNMLSLILVSLVFIWRLATRPQGQAYLDRFVDWDLAAEFGNALSEGLDPATSARIMASVTLIQTQDSPLPEDFLLRGQVWVEGLFPETWFESLPIDIDERVIERESFSQRRRHRIKWLLGRIALSRVRNKFDNGQSIPAKRQVSDRRPSASASLQRRWLHYDVATDTFSVDTYMIDETDSASASDDVSSEEPMSGVEST